MERKLSRRACAERERHTYTDTWLVCVCVYVSQSKRENHPFPQEGGWEIEWPYIHQDMVCECVCVWQKGKPSCSTGGGGFSFLPAPHGGGRGCRRKQSTKPRRWGRGCRRSRGISCSTGQNHRRDILFHGGGGRGEYTMTSIAY